MYKILNIGDITNPKTQLRETSGSRTALLKDGKYIAVINTKTTSSSNDFIPTVSYSDDGLTWSEPKLLFPEYVDKKSVYVSVRNTDDGRISICGWCADIAYPGEEWWNDELSAMKENQLCYTISSDGYDIPPLKFLDLPFYGAAEIPGGMHVDKNGVMTIVYSPYTTIEAREKADTNCLVRMISNDDGKTWKSDKIAVVSGESLYAETWITELASGAKFVSTWQTASSSAPDQWLYAKDGINFGNVNPYPFKGQSTALLALKDGRVLVAYNQRKEHPVGVWVAVIRPDENGLNLIENAPVWTTSTGNTSGNSDNNFSGWTTFSFGEPQITEMKDGTFLMAIWYAENGINGVRYVRFSIE